MKKSNATSADVAQLAGVSQSTVSRSFNPNTRISNETRKKVFAAAAELDYQINKAAQTMINKRSDLVGLVTAQLSDPFRSEFLNTLAVEVQNKGLRPMIIDVSDTQTVDQQLQSLIQYQLSGVIITSGTPSDNIANSIIERGTPVVLVNRVDHSDDADIVNFDNEEAGKMAASAFVQAGKRKLMVVRSKVPSYSSITRAEGFINEISQQTDNESIQVTQAYCERADYDSGFNFANNLIDNGNIPDAIFFCMDYIACGFLDALKLSKKYSSPTDIAVLGCDDIIISRYAAYNLSTIRQPTKEMAEAAVSTLMFRLNEPKAAPCQKNISAIPIYRATFQP